MLKWRHEWEIHQLISPAYTVRWMWLLRNENHTIIPSVPSRKPPISEATRWLLVMGFQRLQRSIGVWHTNIDFSQDHNKLIHPPEVGYLCKNQSCGNQCAALTRLPPPVQRWASTIRQRWRWWMVNLRRLLPALQLIREFASCNTTATSQ